MAQRGVDKAEKEKKYEKALFQEGEKILCYHGPLIYEGKCIHLKEIDSAFEYFIHYNGWSKNWDEWVPEERLLKFNEENVKIKDELMKNSKSAKKTYKRRTSIGSVGDKDENNSRSNSPKPNTVRKSLAVPINKATVVKIEKNERLQDVAAARRKKELVMEAHGLTPNPSNIADIGAEHGVSNHWRLDESCKRLARKYRTKRKDNNVILNELSSIANSLSEERAEEDEWDVFGRLIAVKIRSLKNRVSQSQAEKEISNILSRHQAENDGNCITTPQVIE